MSNKVLVSGIQSSGKLHIGNYFGVLKQNIEIGNAGEYDSYIFIADYHSMTSLTDAKERLENTFDAACVYLALGLDPKKVALFRQSDVPSHTELAWILSTLTKISTLEFSHAYKAKIANSILDDLSPKENLIYRMRNSLHEFENTDHTLSEIALEFGISVEEVDDILRVINFKIKSHSDMNAGLFTYPVLMAADILMYNANIVPVGKDQAQHVEIAREIAGKFNRAYGEFFTMPQAYIVKEVATVPGIDGTKMSKSKNNYIPLFGTDEEIRKRVMSIVTDSARPEDKKNPDENNIYNIHKLFLNKEDDEVLRKKFEDGGYGYKDAKEACAQAVIDFISPKREKYDYYQSHPEEVRAILEEGKVKAGEKAKKTMQDVRKIIGLE